MNSLREVLESEFKDRRERNPSFSLRAFARFLKLSPAQLSQMISGKRTITPKMAEHLAERLGLSPMERLRLLKRSYPQFLAQSALSVESAKKMKLSEDSFRFIADWYHLAILSLIKTEGAKSDPRWIASRLGIPVEQAREAVDRLVRMEILAVKPELKQLCDPLHVVSETPSEAIRAYHKQNLQLSMEKVDTVEMKMREIQSVTMSFNPKRMERAREIIDEFLNKMSDEVESDRGAQEVYTVAVQFFPVTRSEKE